MSSHWPVLAIMDDNAASTRNLATPNQLMNHLDSIYLRENIDMVSYVPGRLSVEEL